MRQTRSQEERPWQPRWFAMKTKLQMSKVPLPPPPFFVAHCTSVNYNICRTNIWPITSVCSPVILWKEIGQPATNCNRRFFNGFRLCNVSLITYQKSQEIPLREVNKKRNLLWSSETRFMSAWERGWAKFFYKARAKIFNLVKWNEISSLHV